MLYLHDLAHNLQEHLKTLPDPRKEAKKARPRSKEAATADTSKASEPTVATIGTDAKADSAANLDELRPQRRKHALDANGATGTESPAKKVRRAHLMRLVWWSACWLHVPAHS